MTTDADVVATLANPTLAGLFVAGLSLGAVYALGYARLGRLLGDDGGGDAPTCDDAENHAAKGGEDRRGGRKARRRKRGKGVGGGGGSAGEGEGEGEGANRAGNESAGRVASEGDAREPPGRTGSTATRPHVLPGGFDAGAADDVSPGPTQRPSDEAQKQDQERKKAKKAKAKKKPAKRQGRGNAADADADEDVEAEAGSETGKEVDVERAAGESTDAVSLPSLSSSDALSGPRGPDKAKARLLAPLSQAHPQREIRPSPSLDTDSSWTHVDRRRLKSKSVEGRTRTGVDAMDVTSSDLTSTASNSPVAERMDDMHLARADLAQRTLAERLAPRLKETGVEDMLEKPDVPTLARVMRVQPQAGETPVPGFSWDDYGDVVEDSVLVHDADEEDDGGWGVVKSRNRDRTRPPQTIATASVSTSQAHTASEAMTKKQRQNARKRELAKVAKAETEAARLQGLAKHQRDLERLRIIEQSRQGGAKRPSGGMQASVDESGKLVWD